MWKISFTCGHLKKYKKMPNQRHVLHFAELDGGGGILEKKFTRTSATYYILLSWMGAGGILEKKIYEDEN